MQRVGGISLLSALWLVGCLEPLPDSDTPNTDASTGGSAGASLDSGLPDAADGADADGDGGDLCSDPTAPDYTIGRLPNGTNISPTGFCNDAFWDSITAFPLALQPDAGLASENEATCKLAWSSEVTPNVLWACCLVKDTDVQGLVDTPDGEAWKDDSVEVLIKGNDQPLHDSTSGKTIVSAYGGFRDSKWMVGAFDPSFDGSLQLFHSLQGQSTYNDTNVDTGYALKFRVNLPFDVVPGQRSRCDLMLNDWDGAEPDPKHIVGFGFDHAVDMSTAGICRFACDP